MRQDWVEPSLQGAALAVTLGLVALAAGRDTVPPAPADASPKPTQVTLSVVEQPPPAAAPPPPAPTPPSPTPLEPPPVQTTASPLPPSPATKPRHMVLPHRPVPPRPVARDTPPPPVTQQQSEAPPRPIQQAPENHSAEAVYVGRLRSLVAGNTRLPDGAAYRLSHPSGDVQVSYRLSRAGAVSGVAVARGSGSAILDRQALQDVSTLRYPPMPSDVYPAQDSHEFVVTVTFPKTGAAEGL